MQIELSYTERVMILISLNKQRDILKQRKEVSRLNINYEDLIRAYDGLIGRIVNADKQI